MRVRCLSVQEPYLGLIEAGAKTIEVRSRPIAPGPLVLARSGTTGHRAEVRVLVDVVRVRELDGDDAPAAQCRASDLEDAGLYGYFIANVRALRRDLVKVACVNCAAGIRDTHAGIFTVDVHVLGSPVKPPPAKPLVAPRVQPLREPARIIRPPTALTAPSPLLAPHAAGPSTALRPLDPFSLRAKTPLEEAIEAFGDTEEVRALFG